jgi:hypothetical protein
MSYDAWKTREDDDPYYDEYPSEEEDPDPAYCDHEDYEADILTGEASCHRCGHRWVQTNEEIAAECRRQADYHEAMERAERRERWLWWWDALRHAAGRWRSRFKGWRQPKRAAIDDDIPF